MLLLLFIVKMLVKLWIEDLSSGSSASIMQCYLLMKWKTVLFCIFFFTNENGSLT